MCAHYWSFSGMYNNYILQQWRLAGYISTNKCVGFAGDSCYIYFTSIIELTPNGYLWIVPLFYSVSDI